MKYNLPWRREIEEILTTVVDESRSYLDQVDGMMMKHPHSDLKAKSFPVELPKTGKGANVSLKELIQMSRETSITTSGPRCFHFVIGGSTPAALAADWLATLYDQIAYAWVSSPLAVQLEIISLNWLAEMLGIPESWGSVMTTGATMSNFVGLAAGRQWVGEQMGIDIAEQGLYGLKPIPVLTSGLIHASTMKALGMLGIGRSQVRKWTADGTGRLDPIALEKELQKLEGQPAILVATAGEPNAGAFDSISLMADLAEKYNCWLHVDGAFGLFAQLSERTSHLLEGLKRAHSITVDGHKWLNVPYDCGFAFVHDPSLLVKSFRYHAEYLPHPDDPQPVMGAIGPESSRRARSLSVWASLQAYGQEGYQKLIEHHLDLAQYLKDKVDSEVELERLAEVPLNIVCFRYHPTGKYTESEFNQINKKLGEHIIQDGRVYVGTTTYNGKVALRPAISNWRTESPDIDLLVNVVLELGKRITDGK